MAALALALAGALAIAATAQAATIEVTTTEDPSGSGSCPGGPCSLRQAVAAASTGDTIKLAGSDASPDVYTLTQGSQIVVGKSVTIEGDGPAATVIDGSSNLDEHGALHRIIKATGGTLSVEGVQFTGGFDGEDEGLQGCSPCETLRADGGGALFNAGAIVALDEVAFDFDGTAGDEPTGGAIGNAGSLEMTDVSFREDSASFGGALFARGGKISAYDVTFEDDGPDAFDGGAVFLYEGGSDSFTNTTIVGSGWPSSFGGGIDNDGAALTLTNDTLSGNIRGALETDVGGGTAVENTILGSGFSDDADFDCVAAGKPNNAGTTTAKAITEDLGGDIDQDDVCGLSSSSDKSGVDPRLAPIADNGGSILTQALLHGSPAIEGGLDEGCPLADGRGVSRPQGEHCDSGAFEAVLVGQPSVTTAPASKVTSAQATLNANVDLDGEAGGFHFLWGSSPSELVNETPEAPAGVVSGEALESEALGELSEETTYYFKAVADNASGSATAGNVQSFTTAGPPGPPVVSNVGVASVTEASATIEFTINPDGADTSYVIEYGPDSGYGRSTAPVDIGSGDEPQLLTRTLTGLEPGSTYHYAVVATNSQAPAGVSSGDQVLATEASKPASPPAPPGNTSGPTATTAASGSSPPAATTSSVPPPVLGKSVDVELVSGTVLIALPSTGSASFVGPLEAAIESASKGLKFIPLTEARQIPVGSTLDATAGVARITTATATVGKTQTGEFGAGIFKLLQSRKQKGLTELDIDDNRGAKQACASLGKKAAVAAKHLSSKTLGRLNANAHGSFSAHGQYSASTVRGTVWSVANQCDGTLTKVARGVVSVRDFRRRKTITLHSGQSYLAKAPL
jgi:hypothetical protein